MKQNNWTKLFFLSASILTLALFLALNLTGLLVENNPESIEADHSTTLDWESRDFDLIILLFFLIGGAFASLRVLPLRKVDTDE